MACRCSNCVPVPKPTDCRCPGDKHVNIHCFITEASPNPIAGLLQRLSLPAGVEGVRQALQELTVRRTIKSAYERMFSPPVNPWG
jgi:hypothetical protein